MKILNVFKKKNKDALIEFYNFYKRVKDEVEDISLYVEKSETDAWVFDVKDLELIENELYAKLYNDTSVKIKDNHKIIMKFDNYQLEFYPLY